MGTKPFVVAGKYFFVAGEVDQPVALYELFEVFTFIFQYDSGSIFFL